MAEELLRQPTWPDISPGRWAATVQMESPAGCRVALLGLADDTGVGMNNGRLGAQDGPASIRSALARYGTTFHLTTGQELSSVQVFDAGDIVAGNSLDETHDAITERVAWILAEGMTPVCLGGGHDLTWPAIRAVMNQFSGAAGVYYDAHLDVREEEGSGMPFRRILEKTSCRSLHVVGLDPFANSREHIEWFVANGGVIETASVFETPEFDRIPTTAAAECFVSFDLDVVACSEAPGVSAINPVGLSASDADQIAYQCGRNDAVRYFDVMELNPRFDIDGRTSRLAARMILSFIAGFAGRESRHV